MNHFLRRYEKLGEKFDPEEIELRKSLRVNTIKIREAELVTRLRKKEIKLEKISFLENGYYYEAEFSLGATPEYLQGYYYNQEAASQIPVQVLEPKPKDLILDMSAAPGGKTTQMAAKMQNKGTIIAVDSNLKRLESLNNNVERLGVKNVISYKKDALYIDDFKILFDKVLLDAPCSGNFAGDEKWFEERDLKGIETCAREQKKLLKAAVKVLKKGGVLVYSTCTLEPEENEENIDWLLKEHPELRLDAIDISIGSPGLTEVFGKKLNPEIKKCKRFWPHKDRVQGFFIAKIKKS